MTPEEMKEEYMGLYGYMANSKDPKNMKIFGQVMTSMITDMIQSAPNKAEEYIGRLEAVKWNNFLTKREAETIVANMNPKAPWTMDQWKQAMEKYGYSLEKEPYYNSCALYTTMNMIMSDSSETLSKYVDAENLFKLVYGLAVDKLLDADGKFSIRKYFDV